MLSLNIKKKQTNKDIVWKSKDVKHLPCIAVENNLTFDKHVFDICSKANIN